MLKASGRATDVLLRDNDHASLACQQRARWHRQLAVRTDAHEAPVPASVEQLTTRALLCIGTASGAFVLPWLAATRLHPSALLLAPVLLVAGLATRRHSTRYRATGLATATGAAATCMLAFGAALIELVHRF